MAEGVSGGDGGLGQNISFEIENAGVSGHVFAHARGFVLVVMNDFLRFESRRTKIKGTRTKRKRECIVVLFQL